VPPEEDQKLRDYLEQGFRDLQLADIKHANESDVRMGTFQLCAAFLDALALAYSAGVKVKGGDGGKWDRFIRSFFDQSLYAVLIGKYESFRCLLLHNFSARGLLFIHDHPELHLTIHNGRTLLNRESFVPDVERAFNSFYDDVRTDEDLRTRVLKHLDRHPPIGVWFLDEPPKGGPPPVATAAMPPPSATIRIAGNGLSASASSSEAVSMGLARAPADRSRESEQ
jgi:hypothetical protein